MIATDSSAPGTTELKDHFSAVIFDMDGVIVDSEPRHVTAFMDVFRELDMEHTHGIEFEAYLGKSDESVWVDFVNMHQPKQSLGELQDWKQNRLIDILREEEPIFPGIPELVQLLGKHVPLAVASGSLHPVIDAVLEFDGLRQYFDAVVSIQDVGNRTKPEPDVYLRAAELLKVNPAEICAIEDSAAGVQAALNAGMQVIAITNSLPMEQLVHATCVVDKFQEVRDLLHPRVQSSGHAHRNSP